MCFAEDVVEDEKKGDTKPKEKRAKDNKPAHKISQEAIKVARMRTNTGFMHPWVYQLLNRVSHSLTRLAFLQFKRERMEMNRVDVLQQEIRIDSCLEDESSRDLPSCIDLYRPVRQNVYSILFDYNKRMLIYRNLLKEMKGEQNLYAI